MTARAWIDEALERSSRRSTRPKGMAYLGEDVTMVQHQLQAGALAAGRSDSLVVAAPAARHRSRDRATGGRGRCRRGADRRPGRAPRRERRAVAVALVRTGCHRASSPSRRSEAVSRGDRARLRRHALRGVGPHTASAGWPDVRADEARAFEALAYAHDAVILRRLDEAAKDASRDAPGLDAHRAVFTRVLARNA